MHRFSPPTTLIPILDIRMPIQPMRSPLKVSPFDVTATIERPNIANIKYSAGPILSANFANIGVNKARHKTPNNPPNREDVADSPRLTPALPCLESGYPSKVVVILPVVPGIPNKQAVIDPPYTQHE